MPERSQFIEIVLMWVLCGLIPLLVSSTAAIYALQHGARAWPDWAFGTTFTALYFGCFLGGIHLWNNWFNNSR